MKRNDFRDCAGPWMGSLLKIVTIICDPDEGVFELFVGKETEDRFGQLYRHVKQLFALQH